MMIMSDIQTLYFTELQEKQARGTN